MTHHDEILISFKQIYRLLQRIETWDQVGNMFCVCMTMLMEIELSSLDMHCRTRVWTSGQYRIFRSISRTLNTQNSPERGGGGEGAAYTPMIELTAINRVDICILWKQMCVCVGGGGGAAYTPVRLIFRKMRYM